MSNETMTKPTAEATKPKRTNEEKLQELYAKRDKLLKRLADVKAQEKSLDKRIAALNEKIKEIERTRLLNMCKERNWTPSDLMDCLRYQYRAVLSADVQATQSSCDQSCCTSRKWTCKSAGHFLQSAFFSSLCTD